jgi:hypothetical protein
MTTRRPEMRVRTVTSKAGRARGGRRARRAIGPGIVTLSLAVALFAATASTASAERTLSMWRCPPPTSPPTDIGQVPLGCLEGPVSGNPSFDFGDRQVGTTSPVQRFALAVWCVPRHPCPDALNPSIGVSSDYVQTNNCPPTLSAAVPGQLQGCIIDVTFSPTGTGPKASTLSTGAGGPTATLTGTGVSTPTPPALPLRLSVGYERAGYGIRKAVLRKKLTLFAETNNDSTVVARGGVKKTVANTVAGVPPTATKIKAKLKHLRRLKESREPKVKIKLAATDEFGQRDTTVLKVEFLTGSERGVRPLGARRPAPRLLVGGPGPRLDQGRPR